MLACMLCLINARAGVNSGSAISDWSLHIVSIQWNGWHLRCSAHTAVHCQWRQYSCHSSSVQRRMLLASCLLCLDCIQLVRTLDSHRYFVIISAS